MSIKFQASVIFVQDIKSSRHFYEELLDQKVLMDHGPNVGFEGGFAIWQIDHVQQTVFERPLSETGQLGRENCEFYFEADDLEAIWSRLSEAGVQVVHPLREQPWGQRVFRIYDPDGHIVELGEPMPVVILRFLAQGMSAEEVAKYTSMPPEIIHHIAKSASSES